MMSDADPGTRIDQRRQEYTRGGLTEREAGGDPIELFRRWFEDAAVAAETANGPVHEPNVMTLATASASGDPSARIVLLKEFGERGFVFFTNYDSRKARDLTENPRATLVFHWLGQERQVRIAGSAEKVSRAESEAYFATRPRGSQLGAWVSAQSEPMSRDEMDERLRELGRDWEGRDVPCPPNWGGFCVRPESVEFWQGRPNRLHDRILFERDSGSETGWARRRLAP